MFTNFPHLSLDQPATYRIIVQGRLGDQWSDFFADLSLSVEENGAVHTILTGPVADQAALHGILNRIRDLNLPLLGVEFLSIS